MLQRQGGPGEDTLNAAFPPNKTGDQTARVAEEGLCSMTQKQQDPPDMLQGSLIFTSEAPDPALKDLCHWQQ